MNQHDKSSMLLRFLLMLLLTAMAVGLGYALLSLPSEVPGLSEDVAKHLASSGVSNPVTAVLLNYRVYDTLLEMAVLLLAILGVWSLGVIPKRREPSSGAVLDIFSRLLVPLLILVAGYLLWVGGHAPGGAFQAGAVLGAAGVLLLLNGWHLDAKVYGRLLRFALSIGLAAFVIAGLVFMLLGRQFMEYPLPFAKALILVIEAAATLSIGVALAALFLGGRPDTESKF